MEPKSSHPILQKLNQRIRDYSQSSIDSTQLLRLSNSVGNDPYKHKERTYDYLKSQHFVCGKLKNSVRLQN